MVSVNTLYDWTHRTGALVWFILPAGLLLRQWLKRPRSFSAPLKLASAGLVACGVIGLFSLIGDPFLSAHVHADDVRCEQHMRRLGEALLMYAEDYDEHLPPATTWDSGAERKLTPSDDDSDPVRCPAARSSYGYSYNQALGDRAMHDMTAPETTVLLFERDSSARNSSGGESDMVPDRHFGSCNVTYADGHVHWITEYTRHGLRWMP